MTIQLPDFTKARVLVVGDIMLDRYWYGDVSRISPEAPVPVVKVQQQTNCPGGAGNVALNVKTLGASVTLLGITGKDETAETLNTTLHAAGIDCHLLNISDTPTITKLRVLSQHQQLIRLDFEEPFHMHHSNQLLDAYQSLLSKTDAVILSDYGKGTLNDSKKLIAAARKKNIPVFVDPKQTDFSVYHSAAVITPNFKEFLTVVGDCPDEQTIKEKSQALLSEHDIGALLITRGENGMTLIRQNEPEIHLPARAQEVYDVTGAGDTVIAVLATSVAAGMELPNAMKLANTAAGIAVSKLGAATISAPELQQALQNVPFGGLMNEEQLSLAIKNAHNRGKKIVMTNGCFDILHAGHVHYLNEAKKLGDRLIVAVNDDASVIRLKGKDRPINSLEKRMAVLNGLSSVDLVIPFSENTPERLISKLLPDILVKGGDYKPDEIAGAKAVIKNGGQVKIIDLVEGCSTTSVINRIEETKQ